MKQNIVFLLDTLQTGGAERSLLQIAREFKKYNPVFVHLFDKGHDLKPEFDEAGIQVINLKLRDSFNYDLNARQAAVVLKRLNPALIHSTLFKSDMISRPLANYLKVPLINSLVNNSYSKHRYRSEPLSIKIKLWLLQQWDAFTSDRVTLFLSNSEAIKATNMKALRISSDRIKVIYRGRSSKPYEAITAAQRNEFRKVMNVSDKVVFTNVSRLIFRKGQLDLLHAFALVVSEYPECVLWLVGEGSFRKTIEKEIINLKLEDKVLLWGNRNDVALLLKSSDYFVFPSHYEGLPGALIEAMFAGVPIIASAIQENLECVNEEMAMLFPARDRNEIYKAMVYSINDEQLSVRTQKSFKYAMENFDIKIIGRQYENLYDIILNKSN